MEQTRAQHLEWAKKRALEYIEKGEVQSAYQSFLSDMTKHPETVWHPYLIIGMQLLANGGLSTAAEMKKFIEDFN